MTIELAWTIFIHLMALPGIFVTIEGLTYYLNRRKQ